MFNDWGKQEINTPTAQICVMSDEFEIWEVGGDNNNRIFKFTETIPGVYSSKQARNELLSYIKTQGYYNKPKIWTKNSKNSEFAVL